MSNVVEKTPNFKLNQPSFDLRLWHTYVNENMDIIDAALTHYLNIDNLTGVWQNSTTYNIGDRVVDSAQGLIYQCLVANVSSPPPTAFTAP